MDPVLNYSVTMLGFLLSAMCFAVIFLGKRIPGETRKQQEVEFQGFKMKTNSIVMLLTVSVVVTVLPLTMQFWLEGHKPQLADTPRQELQIYITGQVADAAGPIEGAKVTVTNVKGVKPGDPLHPLSERVTDSSGSFDFPALPFGEGDRYKVVAAKEGHIEQYFYMGPSGAIDVRTVLVAKK